MNRTIQPRRGGSRLYCPMVDVNATEATEPPGRIVMCGYPSRAMTAKGAKAIRRHVRDHVRLFAQGTEQMMRYVQTGPFGGFPGMRAGITVSRPGAQPDDNWDDFFERAW